MASKEFWAPVDVALDILGFNKNILEKRIAANYIKKEVKDDLEIVEISGEIERFGLSEQVAKDKLETFLSRDLGENVRSIFEEENVSTENPPSANVTVEPESIAPSEPIPVSPSVTPNAQESKPMNNPNIPDYSEQLKYIASMIDEVKSYSASIPQILSKQEASAAGDDSSLISNGFQALTEEIARLGAASEASNSGDKQIDDLKANLKTAEAENVKLSTQCTQIMDELDRNVTTHKSDLDNLRNIMKTEFSEISNQVRSSSSKGGAGFLAILLLLISCGGTGFLISEFFIPKYTILKNQNQNINPLTKEDVSNSVKTNNDDLESKIKEHVNNVNDQIKSNNKKNLAQINDNVNTSLDLLKSSHSKGLKVVKEQQKEISDLLEGKFTKDLKSLNKEVNDLKKLLKRTLETSVQIKPGNAKIINDSKE